MGKFKINDTVRVVSTGAIGTIKGREVTPVEGTKRINIEYVVKLGEGFCNWKTFSKKELEKVRNNVEAHKVYTNVYDVVDGYKIIMYAKVSKLDYYGWMSFLPGDNRIMQRVLNIGYTIYCPLDEYNEQIGLKIARNRSKTHPFCTMYSTFGGEFNEETVKAIMNVKAEYIKNNFDKFIKK